MVELGVVQGAVSLTVMAKSLWRRYLLKVTHEIDYRFQKLNLDDCYVCPGWKIITKVNIDLSCIKKEIIVSLYLNVSMLCTS